MAALQDAEDRTHGRETGADDADGVFDDGPDGWVDVRPGDVFVRDMLDDYGAVGAGYANAGEVEGSQLGLPCV